MIPLRSLLLEASVCVTLQSLSATHQLEIHHVSGHAGSRIEIVVVCCQPVCNPIQSAPGL